MNDFVYTQKYGNECELNINFSIFFFLRSFGSFYLFFIFIIANNWTIFM